MICRWVNWLRAAALLLFPAAAYAQQQEFVRQVVMIAPFHAVGDAKAGRRVASDVRSRVAKQMNKREAEVLDEDDYERRLELSGYDPEVALADADMLTAAKNLRVDEVVLGTVSGKNGAYVVNAQLALMRDWRMRQPLPVIHAPSVGKAAEALAVEVTAASGQMPGLRRCENAMRAGDYPTAMREATQAVRAYPLSVFARTCLMAAVASAGLPSDSVRAIAEAVLAVDSLNILAEVNRAEALESGEHVDDAAKQWSRIVSQRSDSLDLGITAVEALLKLDRPAPALEAAQRLVVKFADSASVRRLMFRAHIALSNWKSAALLGDTLEHGDSVFRADSSYALRWVEALRQSGDTVGALEISARSVRRYPRDVRIYTQYVQVLGNENDVALGRGLVRFPETTDFYVMSAKGARAVGRRHDAIVATEALIKRIPQSPSAYLQLAELWFEEGKPDSALTALARTPRTGPTKETLRSYIIGRGGQLLRSAGDSTFDRQRLAVSFLLLADSIESRDDTRGYVLGASLQAARSQLVAASKTRDCADARRADDAMLWSAGMLERGVGSANADELRTAYESMRGATDTAIKALCKGQ